MNKAEFFDGEESIKEKWKSYRLGEIGSSIKGKRPDKLYDNKDENLIPYINIKAFETGEFDHFTTGKDCRLCDKDDLLIVWDGSRSGLVGKAYNGAVCSTIAKIDIEGVINSYGYYFLLSQYQYLNTNTKGTGTPHVDPDLLWDLEILVPPIETQHRIVEKIEELFSELDNGVENLKKAKQQLKTYRQAILKAAFEGKLTKEWREQQDDLPTPEELKQQIEEERKRHREQQLKEWENEVEEWKEQGENRRKPRKPRKSKEFKDLTLDKINEIGNLPDKWFYAKLGNVCLKITDGTHKSPKNDQTGNYKYITAKNIKEYKINLDDITYVSKEDHQKIYSRCDVRKDDVLYIKDGATTGKAAVNDLEEEFSLLSSVAIFRTCHYLISPKYLAYYLNSGTTRKRMLINISGNAITRLTLTKLNNSILSLCSPKEQKKIVEEIESRLSIVDQTEKTINQELQKVEALRQSILKQAFEGKLVNKIVRKRGVTVRKELTPFQQMQMIGILINILGEEYRITFGEMALAKCLYLIDRIKQYKTGFIFKDWHWGPYDPNMKGLIYKKGGFFRVDENRAIKIKDEKQETLLKYKLPNQTTFESGIRELSQIISKFEGRKPKGRQLELLATVCKVVENENSIDLITVRGGMEKWKTEKAKYMSKAAKFSVEETKRCLKFIKARKWHNSLIN